MMRRDSVLKVKYVVPILSVFFVLTASCATKRDFMELRDDIHEQKSKTESRLSSLEQSVAELDSLTREQYSLSQSIRALLGTQGIEQRDNINLIMARQDEIAYQLRQLLDKLQVIQLYGGAETTTPTAGQQTQSSANTPQTKTPGTPPTTVTTQTAKVDPQELYDSILKDIQNGNFQLAENRFLSFLMQFPKHELASNAQYWLGEAVYGQEKYELAITEFQKVITKYPKSPKAPAALLKIGFSQLKQGHNKDGTATLNRLIKSYPSSEEAELARERLNTP